MSKIIKEYDDKGNVIYYKNIISNYEYWREYDEKHNVIYHKSWNSNNKFWHEYDGNNKLIHQKYNDGREFWYKNNENNEKIDITKQEYENIKIREYNSRTKCSRFELIEI